MATPMGGGIYMLRNVELRSTLVADNTIDSAIPNDIAGNGVLSGSNNLIGTSLITPPAGTLVSATPGLLPLAWNGGPTRTHALARSSLAIDRGSNLANLATDQRGDGHPRVLGLRADIGASELDTDRIFINGFD